MNTPFRDRALLLAFLIVLVAFGVLAARKILVSRPPEPVALPAETQEAPKPLREVTLYFGAPQGERLVAEAREIACLDESECVRETVQALVNGPATPLVPVIPDHAVVQRVEIDNSTATVSFSREIVSDHPGGSLSELFTVYGLANTLAVNFPHIRQVKILVEGETVETLKGHVGLREPVQADFRYGRSLEEGSAGGKEPESMETRREG